jgi:hypothetical protein
MANIFKFCSNILTEDIIVILKIGLYFLIRSKLVIMTISLILLWLTALLTKVWGFAPTTYNYSEMQLSLLYLACSDDLNICTFVNGNKLYLYSRSTTNYSVVATVEPVCSHPTNPCILTSNFIKQDGTRAICYSSVDSQYKIYAISSNAFFFLQTIPFSSPYFNMQPVKSDYLCLCNVSIVQVYAYDNVTSQYALTHSSTFSASGSIASDILPSGSLMVILFSNMTLLINQLSSGSYATTSIVLTPPMASSSYVYKVCLSERSNGDYVLVVIMNDGVIKKFSYYTITGTTATLRQ